MNYIVGGESKQKINIDEFDTNKIVKFNKEDYIIRGICDDDFDMNINMNERVHIECVDGKFECELDIIPTSLDYMLIQNIDEYIKSGETIEPIRPENVKITKMCSLKYITNINKIL